MPREANTPADTGRYKYLPFEVPHRVDRLHVELLVSAEANSGVGLNPGRKIFAAGGPER